MLCRWHIILFLQNIGFVVKLKQFNNCNIVTNIWGVTYCCHNNTCQFVVGQVVHAPGYFHLTNISGLHSRKLPEFLEKRTSAQDMRTSARYEDICTRYISLRTVLSRNVFPFHFHPIISKIFGWVVCFLGIFYSLGFLETFQEIFWPLVYFKISSMESAFAFL